jgi:hypothetical protein
LKDLSDDVKLASVRKEYKNVFFISGSRN